MEIVSPKVSVAVITYNMEDYLCALLDSILKQKVDFPYEIVIDDDCSPDGSREIIQEYQKRYPDRIYPIYRNENVGGSRNMWGVLNRCHAQYIALLEGDDFWETEDKLQKQITFLDQHPEYIGMTCNSWCEHGKGPAFADVMRKRTEPKVFSLNDFLTGRHFHDRLPSSTDTWVFRNFLHDGGKYSLFYEAHNMIWDQSLALILYGKGYIYASPELVSHHRNVVNSEGTNYQSVISRRNCLYEDSKMYKAMEKYITDELHQSCGLFYLVRGDVWVDAFFRALKTGTSEDRKVERRIRKEQRNKIMLAKLLVAKIIDILGRKLGLHE